MANIWVPVKCPGCDKPVDGEGVLVATVRVTNRVAYRSYGDDTPDKVRPLFRARSPRVMWHLDCLPLAVKKPLNA